MTYSYDSIIKLGLYTSFAVLYVCSLFFEYSFIEFLLGMNAMVIVPLSFRKAAKTFQWMSIIFVGSGVLIAFQTGLTLKELPEAFTSTALLLSLLYFLPFINNLMVVGKYDMDLQNLLQMKAKHLGQLYYRSSLISYILCLFVFFSSISIVHKVVEDTTTKTKKAIIQKFSSQSILRAFALANVWSPIEIFIALTVTITGVGYFRLLPWALLFSLCLLFVDWGIGWFIYRRITYEAPGEQRGNSLHHLIRKTTGLLLMLFLFIFSAYGVQSVLEISYFNAVILLIFPFTLLWSLLIKRFRAFLQYNYNSLVPQVNGLQNMMLLFISLGFFSEMFERTTFISILQKPLLELIAFPLILFMIIQLLSLLLSFAGLHPLVTISLMGTLIQPLLNEMNPLSFAIVLLTSTLASDAAGTFNTTVTIMSQLTKRNPYRITGWNLYFALAFGTFGSLLGWVLL